MVNKASKGARGSLRLVSRLRGELRATVLPRLLERDVRERQRYGDLGERPMQMSVHRLCVLCP